MIKEEFLERLLQRTYKFLGNLAPVSPTMRTNLAILQNAQSKLFEEGKLWYDANTTVQRARSQTHHELRAAMATAPGFGDGIRTSGFSAANAASSSFSSTYSQ